MMNLVYLNQCGFTIDTTEDPTAWDWSCIGDECGSAMEATIGCDYTNCDQGSNILPCFFVTGNFSAN